MIEVDNLTVRFGPRTPAAVKGVSFSIETNTAFGLVGESGCGKSTVLRAISGLNSNYGGRIMLDGERPRCSSKPFVLSKCPDGVSGPIWLAASS